jgi:hypothetical protein
VAKKKGNSKVYEDNNLWVKDEDDLAIPKSSSSSE